MLHLLFIGFVFCGQALMVPVYAAPRIHADTVPAQLVVPATSYLVMNLQSNTVMLGVKAHDRLPPASLTKLMTLTLVYDAIAAGTVTLDSKFLVSRKSWSQPGSRMFLEQGTHVSVQELIQGIAVVSGNDASVTVAEHIAGNEAAFAVMMNDKAQSIGMHNTHFMNATGLPHAEHYSSAYDLSLLAAYIHKKYPQLLSVMQQKHYTFNQIKQNNRNHLLWTDTTVTGMKTGHTDRAGYCLVVSAQRNDDTLIAVSLGSQSERKREQAGKILLHYGDYYFKHITIARDTPLPKVKTRYASTSHIQPRLAFSKSLTLPKDKAIVKTRVELVDEVHAPLKPGTVIGHYHLSCQGGTDSIPIVAVENLESAPFLSRVYDWIDLQLTLGLRYITHCVGFSQDRV